MRSLLHLVKPGGTVRNALLRFVPRPVLVVAAEISGAWSVRKAAVPPPRGFLPAMKEMWARARPLFGGTVEEAAYPLFDCQYYLNHNPDVAQSHWPPLLHFLIAGGFEKRQPHPLFDPDWYATEYPDIALSRLNPLQHYSRFGWRERRSPHPLFDAEWYVGAYPDVKAAGCDAVIHFLRLGGLEGRQPHRLFDAAWYMRRHAEVRQSGMNPLVHYLLAGGKAGLDPNPAFNAKRYAACCPELAALGLDALTHYLTAPASGLYNPHPGYPRPARSWSGPQVPAARSEPLVVAPSSCVQPPAWRNSLEMEELAVFLVYGAGHVSFIESHLLPALAAQQCSLKIRLHTLHYRNSERLLPPSTLSFARGAVAGVSDWSATREDRHIGFGEAMNHLFERVAPKSCFLMVNPDSLPMAGCLERLLNTFSRRNAALVEARQWPAEHPKEFNPHDGSTPWASAAFLLVSSPAFQRLGGFDPIYFLYNEDVDLSWRAWLNAMPVVYEPAACCAHFTGGLSYGSTRYYFEQFFGYRNFPIIAYKFFGERGERAAWRWIEEARLPAALHNDIRESYYGLRDRVVRVPGLQGAPHADKVKILGLNIYHELRRI